VTTSQPLWRWRELCVALGLPAVAGPDVTGISIDSRTLAPGELFVALKGDPGPRFNVSQRSDRDGHDFVAAALARGAAGVLVHRAVSAAAPQLIVSDTLDGLWKLGAAARARFGGRSIAVTGSSGKTTAKTFLSTALDCPASTGSLNNFWGVPLSLARTPPDAAAAVFEIGTNHPGEIAPLARLARPHVALVLNVGQAHLEYFADWDALRREKLSIAEGLEPGGTLVVPDDLNLEGVQAPRVVRFGESGAADVRLIAFDAAATRGRFRVAGHTVEANVPGGGRHRALTVAAVLACMHAAGFPLVRALGLSDELVPAGRGRRHRIGEMVLIDDSYNANPVSMRAALDSLSAEPGRRYAVLGEMRELGALAPQAHRDLASACARLDGVVCVGAGTRPLYDALRAEQRLGFAEEQIGVDLDALAARLARPATVLVKGSNRVFWVHGFVGRLIQALTVGR